MDPLIGGALVGAGSSFVNSIFGQGQARKNQRRQFDHNKQMAELEFQNNLAMWNKQNEYNTPAMQMERFTKAGLNKNLIYGQGTPGNAREMPKYQIDKTDMQQVPALNIGDTLAQYNSTKIANAQVDRLQKQTQLDEKKIITEGLKALLDSAKIPGVKADSKTRQVISKYQTQMSEALLNVETKKTQKLGEEIRGIRTENDMKKIDRDWLKSRQASRLEPQMLRTIKEIWANTKNVSMQSIFKAIANIIGTDNNLKL